MHIPDVVLDPKVAAVTGAGRGGGIVLSVCGRRSGISASGRRC